MVANVINHYGRLSKPQTNRQPILLHRINALIFIEASSKNSFIFKKFEMALFKICISLVLLAVFVQGAKIYRPNANSAYFRVQRILSNVPDEGNENFNYYKI